MTEVPPDWSRRSPQRFFFALLAVLVTIAIVATALGFIREGAGGIVPYFMLLVGPVLGGFYVWNFTIRKD